MKKEQFDDLIAQVDTLIASCKEVIPPPSVPWQQLTVEDMSNRITASRKLQSKMDYFLKSDLYHILGMGNLDARQQSVFVKKAKEYLTYRPYIQTLSCCSVPVVQAIKKGSCDYTSKLVTLKLKKAIDISGS